MQMQLSDVNTWSEDGKKWGALYGLDHNGQKQRVSVDKAALGQFTKGGSYLIEVDAVQKGNRTFYNFLRVAGGGTEEDEVAKYERLAREAKERKAQEQQQHKAGEQGALPPILSNVLAHAVGNGVKAEDLPAYGVALARAIRAFKAETAVPGGGTLEPESVETGPGMGPTPPDDFHDDFVQ